jgi:xylulokinase
MGERSPLLDSDARGAFIGLSAIHTRFDMLRAIMEGVAFSQRECLDILRGMGVAPDEMLICGGGGGSAFWRQMLADVYGCAVYASVAKEGPALGAAILAGVAAGAYADVESACAKLVSLGPSQQPDLKAGAEYAKYYGVYKALYPALKSQYKALASI